MAYEKEGPLYLSTFFAMTYGVGFAALTATIVHVALFHGRYNFGIMLDLPPKNQLGLKFSL